VFVGVVEANDLEAVRAGECSEDLRGALLIADAGAKRDLAQNHRRSQQIAVRMYETHARQPRHPALTPDARTPE